jgi:hypothetical protein
MRRSTLVVLMVAAVIGPVLALRAQPDKDQPHGDIRIDCGDCHNPERWTPVVKPPAFRHESSGFALLDAHAQASCRSCHRSLEFAKVGTACADCHQDAHRGELGPRCETCHTPTTWTNQRQIFQVHSGTRFPLMAVHARLDCAACHGSQRPYQYRNTPAECGACHYDDFVATRSPSHVQSGFPRTCENCHLATASSWHEARFSHESFPLAGGHSGLACARCHGPGTPRPGLSTQCLSCHQASFAAATQPSHNGFPTQCENCHTIASWRGARFEHTSAFPLTGAHQRAECAKCHAGGRYQGTPKDCSSCHQSDYARTTNPNHQASGFPTQCETCHTTAAWKPAAFDHKRFPLTGAHGRVDCTMCHAGGRYQGTPTDCYSCHQQDYARTGNPNHQAAGFPTQCQTCHDTSAWRPATFDHDGRSFPIYSGTHRGKWSSCGDCHVNAGNYRSFECIRCHEHANRAEVDKDHREVSGYTYASQACYQCHRSGRASGTFGPRSRGPAER